MDMFDPPYPYHISQFIVDMLRKGALDGKHRQERQRAVPGHLPRPMQPGPGRPTASKSRARSCARAATTSSRCPPSTIREKTFCCGAGGGLLTDELMPIRMAGGKPRAMAVKHSQANFLATICAICKAQLPEAMNYWDVPVEVGGVMQLLGNALKL